MLENLNISPEEFELIENYLGGQLEAQEEAQFLKQLATDGSLQMKVSEVKRLLTGLYEIELEKKIASFKLPADEKLPAKTTGKVIPFKRWMQVAAAVLIIATAGFWWLNKSGNANETLYAKYYVADPGLPTTMAVSGNYIFDKAMVEYKNGEYGKAIAAWEGLAKTQPGNDTITYFLGVAHLGNKKYKKAEDFLTRMVDNAQKPFYKEACWYLGLCYLRMKELDKAKIFLEKSAIPERIQLLNEINK